MHVQPYLFLDGRCEEAIGFWQAAIGAVPGPVMRFRDNPDPAYNPPGSDDLVMHTSFHVGETEIMASDGRCTGTPSFAGFALSIAAADPAEAQRLFDALAEGGQVQMPLAATFFSPAFGMVADRFGVAWMVIARP